MEGVVLHKRDEISIGENGLIIKLQPAGGFKYETAQYIKY